MAEETLMLVPAGALDNAPVPYVVDFSGQQRRVAGVRYRLGQNAFSGPVAQKVIARDGAAREDAAKSRLQRELDVARYLGTRGGELLSKCVGYNFDESPASAVVTYHGRPLADLARDEANWPLGHARRTKIITDLLQGLELLRVSRIVHGGIGLDTLYWDGTALQITDFGQAALSGKYPDGRPAHHGDDIYAAGRVIYHVYTGQPPPADPAALRQQIEHVQDAELRDLLLQRDLVAGTDRDYVFAADQRKRPTARLLLDRLDKRPHGIQWAQLVDRDRRTRDNFRHLRDRQRRFRAAYRPPASRRAAPWPPWTVPGEHPRPAPGPGSIVPARRPPRPWLVVAAAAGLVIGILALLGVL